MSIPNPKCTTCKCFWKPDETDIKSSGLIYKTCKRCREREKEYRNKEENKTQQKQYNRDNKEQYKQYYQNNKEQIRQYKQENQEKIKEYKKQYCQENQDKIKQYRQENQDKIKQYRQKNQEKTKQYFQENKEKINELRKQYLKDVKQNNTPLYLCILQRQQLSRVIKKCNKSKKGHSIDYLGCNAEDFKNFLQSKMDLYNQKDLNEIKMDFQNIHIDHIKPISKFNLDDEDDFNSCCHYSNLQPLLIKDNLSKNAKWSEKDNKYWLENIRGTEYLEIYIPS